MTEKEASLIIGKELRSIIDAKGLKCKYVAEKGGYTTQQLSDMLNGRRIISTIDLVHLCPILDVSPNRVMQPLTQVPA